MSPERRDSGPYRGEVRVAFDLCDPAGVLFFGNVFPLAHRAFEGLLDAAGIPWENWFASPDWRVPVSRASADYSAPLPAGCSAETEVGVTEMRNAALVVETVFRLDETVCARVETVHVFVDSRTGATRAIPEAFRTALGPFGTASGAGRPPLLTD